MCCKVPRCWLQGFKLVVGYLEGFLGCGCILLMCIGFVLQWILGPFRCGVVFSSIWGAGEDWMHIFVCSWDCVCFLGRGGHI